jgi:hypothetical protein
LRRLLQKRVFELARGRCRAHGRRFDELASEPVILSGCELRGTGMARFFREPDRRQRYLLPVDMMG